VNVAVTEKKRPRGRPRKYKDNAEKQKAFRENKKKHIESLEDRIKELEIIFDANIDKKIVKKQAWDNFTFQDIHALSTDQLKNYRVELKKLLGNKTIHSPIRVIIEEVLSEIKSLSDRNIRNEILLSTRNYDNSLFNSTMLHLINLELGTRIDDIDIKKEIEIAEQRIRELEASDSKQEEQEIKIKKS